MKERDVGPPAQPAVIQFFTFDRLLTTLLFLAIAIASFLMPAQSDTWWQLRAGHEMWQTKHILLHDTFSHTVYGVYWPNHEWLSQILFYGAYAAGGMPFVTIVAATAVLAAWLLVWRLTPGSTRAKFLLTAFVIGTASTLWSPRPQVLSLLLLALMMTLLSSRRYVWLPVVFLLWANLHGAVVMGLVLLGAALVTTVVEHRKSFLPLGLAFVGCLLATSATPLGLTFWTEIPKSLGRIRQLRIQEWAPPRVTSMLLLPFWIIAVALVGLAIVRARELARDGDACRRGHLTFCACALTLLPLAVTAERNVPPFLLLAVPAIAVLIPLRKAGGLEGGKAVVAQALRPANGREAALKGCATLNSEPQPSNQRLRLNAAITAVAAAFVAGTVAYAYARPIEHMQWAPLPAASLTALRTCRGNLYNRYDEGGYLIWFAPEHKVFLDGRQDPYPVDLVKDQVRVESTGDFASLFRRYDIHCAFVPGDSLVSAHLSAAGWTPLFRDAIWAVFRN